MNQACYDWLASKGIMNTEKILQAGSERLYERVYTKEASYIVCYNACVPENETFFYFTEHFSQAGIPVPQLFFVSDDSTSYIVRDGGKLGLLDIRLAEGDAPAVYDLYVQAIQHLVRMQIPASRDLDFTRCFAQGSFNHEAVLNDLQYFATYYWQAVFNRELPEGIHAEFVRIAERIEAIPEQYFMYRDFQGRNIMVHDNQVCFIDYQGGMRGPLVYDIASLLWQAKAALPVNWKQTLFDVYKQAVAQYIAFNEESFNKAYQDVVLVRLLQVLGAYGRRGILERKPHFLSSIPQGLDHIAMYLAMYDITEFPLLQNVLQTLINHPPHVDA